MIGGLVNLILDGLIVAFGVVVKRVASLWEPRPYMCDACALCEAKGVCSNPCQCDKGVNTFGDSGYPVQELPDDLWVPPNSNSTLVFRHEPVDKSGIDRSAFLTELASATEGLGTFHPRREIYGPDPDSPQGEWVDPELLRTIHPPPVRLRDEFNQ